MKIVSQVLLEDNLLFNNSGKNLDLNSGYLKGAIIESLGSEPAATLGRIIMKDGALGYYNGTQWHYLRDLTQVIENSTSVNLNWDSGSKTLTAVLRTVAGGGIEVVTDGVQLKNTPVAPGTYTKLTVDAKGRATYGTILTSDDLPSHTHTYSQISDFHSGVRLNRLDQMAIPTAALNINNQRVSNVADPVDAKDAVNKQTLDAAIAGLKWKAESVHAATTANITLSGQQTIDGITTVYDNRYLVKNQNTSHQNGIYICKAGAWLRATDADDWEELVSAAIWVDEGTTNGDTGWVCTIDSGGVLNTDSISFTQFVGGSSVVAGEALSKDGNILNVNIDNTTIQIVSDMLQAKLDLGLTSTASGIKLDISSDFQFDGNSLELADSRKYKKYATTISGGTSTNTDVTHNLGTTDVQVTFIDESTGEGLLVDWSVSTHNVIVVDTNNYDNNIRVVVS